jgi:hypothetical protein
VSKKRELSVAVSATGRRMRDLGGEAYRLWKRFEVGALEPVLEGMRGRTEERLREKTQRALETYDRLRTEQRYSHLAAARDACKEAGCHPKTLKRALEKREGQSK